MIVKVLKNANIEKHEKDKQAEVDCAVIFVSEDR